MVRIVVLEVVILVDCLILLLLLLLFFDICGVIELWLCEIFISNFECFDLRGEIDFCNIGVVLMGD